MSETKTLPLLSNGGVQAGSASAWNAPVRVRRPYSGGSTVNEEMIDLPTRLRMIRGNQFTPLENVLVGDAADRIAELEAGHERLREAATAVGSVLDDWIKIIGMRAPLNPDLKHYFWKRDPTWDEVQEAMRANNELAEALSPLPQGEDCQKCGGSHKTGPGLGDCDGPPRPSRPHPHAGIMIA